MKGVAVLRVKNGDDLVVPSESNEQRKVCVWARNTVKEHPQLALLYAVPNGGSRRPAEAAIMKSEGVQAGVPDLCLPWPSGAYCGLYIEMKRLAFGLDVGSASKWGTISTDQIKWLEMLSEAGHYAVVCPGAGHAIKTIIAYCAGDDAEMTALNKWWNDMPDALLDRVTKRKSTGRRRGGV